jgi:toxin secretion/phage lysis holin
MASHSLDVFIQPIRDTPQAQVALVALCILIVLDMLFGFCAAAKDGRVQSSVMRQGLWHKASEFGVVMVADVADGMLLGGIDLGYGAPVVTAAIVGLCANELVSVCENLVRLNPELSTSRVLDRLLESKAVSDAMRGAGDDAGR